MKIGLYNLEPNIVNTAMMQVSQYHKEQGDTVEPYLAFNHEAYDKVYAFSIFNFTPKTYVRPGMICGGTGFDVRSRLPVEIEACGYDYSIFPKCDFSIAWFSRGCIRNCPFCIVREKEGFIHPVDPKNLNPKGKWVKVADNNFFASQKWREAIETLRSWGQPVEIQQGVDARLVDDEKMTLLCSLKHYKRIHTAWDNPRENIVPKLELMARHIRPGRITCYILVGYWSTPEEDLMRVEAIHELGITPFVMPYNKFDRYQRDFARWVNGHIYNVADWKDYDRDHSFKKWRMAVS